MLTDVAGTNVERLLKTIVEQCVSEKSSRLTESYRQYVFKVANQSCKHEIKNAVEMVFDVKVDNVRVLNVKGKLKHYKRMPGYRKDWKKAYVKLKPGYEINLSKSN
ncbi:50S ribosomal protein L23 [soil metagenome]